MLLAVEAWELLSYVVTVVGLPLAVGAEDTLNAEQKESARQARRWNSWENYMLEWCRRPDFRASLSRLLHGEDPSSVRYVERLATSSPQR